MSLFVIKFGGTSLADHRCIMNAASIVADLKEQGHKGVVVVSAMAGETDRLVSLAQEFSSDLCADQRVSAAHDVIVSSGEQISSGLLSLACQSLGLHSEAIQGWQVPIVTSSDFSRARIEHVSVDRLNSLLAQKITPIVSGFQGVDDAGCVTTFGRGGSDVSAVVIAAALGADECRLYKDVDGVLTADPKLVSNPKVLDKIGIEEMFEQCSQGAKIIHPRAIEAAMRHDVPLRVLPTFRGKNATGTFVSSVSTPMESETVSGIVCNKKEVRFMVQDLPSSPGATAPLFSALAAQDISIDMILLDGHHLSFTVPIEDASIVSKTLEKLKPQLDYGDVTSQKRIAKVSVVGVGMRGHASVASVVGEALEALGISMYGMTSTELKLSVLVSDDYADAFVALLHDRFKLRSVDSIAEKSQSSTTPLPL